MVAAKESPKRRKFQIKKTKEKKKSKKIKRKISKSKK